MPTPRGEARRLRSRLDDLDQPLLLGGRQLLRAPAFPLHPQPVGPLQEEAPQPLVDGRAPKADSRGDRVHRLAPRDPQQGRHPLDQGEVAGLEGRAQGGLQLLAGRRSDAYAELGHRWLLDWCQTHQCATAGLLPSSPVQHVF